VNKIQSTIISSTLQYKILWTRLSTVLTRWSGEIEDQSTMAPRSSDPFLYRLGSYFEFSDSSPPKSISHEHVCILDDDDNNTIDDVDDLESGKLKPRKRKVHEVSNISHRVPVTTSLPLLVFLDSFAVSLVVPLLFQYYLAAGVKQASHREYLSSLFSTAQILGGLSIGVLTDSKVVSRHTILQLSFGGSALSYAMIVYGGLPSLVISRVLVGLVKHTMTVATTILTKATTRETRARHMGRLSASITLAWIIGPVAGSLLWQYVDRRSPALLACAIFILNMLIAAILIPRDDNRQVLDENEPDMVEVTKETKPTSRIGSLLSNFSSCWQSRSLMTTVAAQLLFTWVQKATNSSQLGSFYEDMYGLQPHHRGYVSSYQELIKFVTQALLVGPAMAYIGGERKTTSLFVFAVALSLFIQASGSLFLFLVLVCPISSLGYAMISLSLQSLVTHLAPSSSIFSILAALDVLQNVVSVSVPFYRTWLFTLLTPSMSKGVAMQGDPDPTSWTLACTLHWIIAAVVMSALLLLWHREEGEEDNAKKEKRMD
jgi:MFS transporter, DHA1 family, tetracycline resistance protein